MNTVRPFSRVFSAPFSTSSTLLKSSKSLNEALLRRRENIGRQQRIQDQLDSVDPVLGRPDVPFIQRVKAEVVEPTSLSYGYNKEDVDKLLYGAQRALLDKSPDYNAEQILQTEARRREAISRILDIKNGSKALQKKHAIELARREFQRFEGDTGSSEVQAAILTMRIHYLTDHMRENKYDYQSIRKLRMMVQQRQSLLKYLKRSEPERYFWAIEKLGLTERAVTMEFNLDREYMQKFKIFGDDVMVRESKKMALQRQKDAKRKKDAEKAARVAQAANEEISSEKTQAEEAMNAEIKSEEETKTEA